ncbi:MAG: hypothetical protein ACXAEU_15180 [Candidatus Hodarchaeales archaeon]|jgi:hypothetical protein
MTLEILNGEMERATGDPYYESHEECRKELIESSLVCSIVIGEIILH